MVIEAIAGGDVEPRLTCLLEAREPALPGLTAVPQRGEDLARVAIIGEQVVDAALHGELREPAQLIIGKSSQFL